MFRFFGLLDNEKTFSSTFFSSLWHFYPTFQHKACLYSADTVLYTFLDRLMHFGKCSVVSLIACCQNLRFIHSRGMRPWRKFPNLLNLRWVMRLNVVSALAGFLPLSCVGPVKTSWQRRGFGGGCIPFPYKRSGSIFGHSSCVPHMHDSPGVSGDIFFPRDLCIHASWVIFICHVSTPRSSVWFPETRFALWKWPTQRENQQIHRICQYQHKSVGFSIWH